jgi:nucleotide-binding universal stress UspA family protein
MIFNKIGLAVTFSPNGKALLQEAKRLSSLFGAQLLLIHVGEKTSRLETELNELIIQSSIKPDDIEIAWETGEPARSILKVCHEKNVDLLIAGALEKEKSIKYYAGSIARKIMREAQCSVLIKVSPKIPPVPYHHFCVSTTFSPEGENTIKRAFDFARLEKADQFVLLKEFQVPGLAMTVYDSGSIKETEENLANWQKEEKEKLQLFVKELGLAGIEVKTECLYGKEGYEAGKYVKETGGEILVLTGSKSRLKFFDRVFQHDLEFLFENIPCDLLIIKPYLQE